MPSTGQMNLTVPPLRPMTNKLDGEYRIITFEHLYFLYSISQALQTVGVWTAGQLHRRFELLVEVLLAESAHERLFSRLLSEQH
jgi:hypothetical protein